MNHKLFEQKIVSRFNYLAKLQIGWAVVFRHFTATVRPAKYIKLHIRSLSAPSSDYLRP